VSEELVTLDQELKDAVEEAGALMREHRSLGNEQTAWSLGRFRKQLLLTWALLIQARERET
jgi:FtsZ-binding cell division protein ZapB